MKKTTTKRLRAPASSRAKKATKKLSAAPGGSSDQPTKALLAPGGPKAPVKKAHVAPGKSQKAITLEVVEEPKPLIRKSVTQCYTLTDPGKIEAAICEALADEEVSRRRSALADLRSGVLFHLYKISLGVAGRKYTGFWEKCETRFGVNRMTISRKMRLALIWAKECGAKQNVIQLLAQATDLTDSKNAGVPLALQWIGDRTTTDLYREYGLVNYGPQGGDRNSGKKLKRRSKKEVTQAKGAKEAGEQWKFLRSDLHEQWFNDRLFEHLDDAPLCNFVDLIKHIYDQAKDLRDERGLKPSQHITKDWI